MARDVQVGVGLVNLFKEKKNNKKNNCIKKKQFHEIIFLICGKDSILIINTGSKIKPEITKKIDKQ